ncbi:DNA-directed RNA polymerase subunit alpha [Aquifex aeolicus]|uniref:DNA-directed RNA polymerase subunit alpha n=1 Tax=Aquifex aeolicus (strain VF5) TaxID=224324 RepID=RPOA_AQUAE|nr:DNA-directed RNA polymerase subunit alpha [Aquifex aeolicus]O66483.1 RecName: Full=DNA-directed RNA polymerase subunit alpha; Short=RNAP subunit alpha; AltName: Full=RNA polymerase subunit alpha; AltName: Full=Transcriptase subunit alpha [Aquifex aeolicus VF5]AAC06440.1 RNA polymerase alpha subunit [Aquifex aeolicus VF5]
MLNEFIYPDKIFWEEKTDTYGRLVVEPLERGFGTTVGNSLRRVLLSSISGTAITAVKIYGIYHEFSAIEGVQEDAIELIANLKKIKFLMKGDSDVEILYLQKKGEGEVKASDIKTPPNVEILNPDQYIATITDPNKELNIEIRVERGRGYVPVEEMEAIGEVGWILVDADFSPVKKVGFRVDNVRVGKKSTYERLTLEIFTNGIKTPDQCMQEAIEILKKHYELLENIFTEKPTVPQKVAVDELAEKLSLSIEELDISQRALNSLKRIGITTIGDLVRMTEDELKSTKNIGRKALAEIKEALHKLGLELGMNIETQR